MPNISYWQNLDAGRNKKKGGLMYTSVSWNIEVSTYPPPQDRKSALQLDPD